MDKKTIIKCSMSYMVFFAFLAVMFANPVRAALVGHWTFDGDAKDSTGNHTSVTNGTHIAYSTADKVVGTGSLQLNSGNQADTWLQIADKADLQFGTNDFSVCYWFKKLHSSVNYSDTYGVDKWRSGASPGQNEWTLNLSTGNSPAGDDKPTFAIETSGGSSRPGIFNPTNASLNVWHFLVGARRGSVIELYVDGIFTGSTSIPDGTAVNNVGGGRDLYIGMSAQGTGFGANALYDDLQIYNHALSNGGATVGQAAGGEIALLFANPGLDSTKPVIITQPANQASRPGGNATFSVGAVSVSPPSTLTYQGRYNTTNLISYGTNANLTITNVGGTSLGYYDVIVSDTNGSALSAKAQLSLPRLGITVPKASKAVQIRVEGPVNGHVRLDLSTNLTNWSTLTNLIIPSNPFTFTNGTASGASTRFYRGYFSP